MLFISKHLLIFLLFIGGAHIFGQSEYTISVQIENLKNDKGQVLIGLYNSKEEFLQTTFKGQAASIKNGVCSVVFKNVPEGVYVVSYIHDTNKNGKLDTNLLGIPKEDYGCSNDAKGFMGPPKWEDAKFELKADKSIIINQK